MVVVAMGVAWEYAGFAYPGDCDGLHLRSQKAKTPMSMKKLRTAIAWSSFALAGSVALAVLLPTKGGAGQVVPVPEGVKCPSGTGVYGGGTTCVAKRGGYKDIVYLGESGGGACPSPHNKLYVGRSTWCVLR